MGKVAWDVETDRKLLICLIDKSAKSYNSEALSEHFPGATAKAIEERIAKLKREAKELDPRCAVPLGSPHKPKGNYYTMPPMPGKLCGGYKLQDTQKRPGAVAGGQIGRESYSEEDDAKERKKKKKLKSEDGATRSPVSEPLAVEPEPFDEEKPLLSYRMKKQPPKSRPSNADLKKVPEVNKTPNLETGRNQKPGSVQHRPLQTKVGPPVVHPSTRQKTSNTSRLIPTSTTRYNLEIPKRASIGEIGFARPTQINNPLPQFGMLNGLNTPDFRFYGNGMPMPMPYPYSFPFWNYNSPPMFQPTPYVQGIPRMEGPRSVPPSMPPTRPVQAKVPSYDSCVNVWKSNNTTQQVTQESRMVQIATPSLAERTDVDVPRLAEGVSPNSREEAQDADPPTESIVESTTTESGPPQQEPSTEGAENGVNG